MRKISLVLTVAIALVVILVYWQNRDIQLSLVMWGQPLLPRSLSTILAAFYGIGAGIGALIIVSWQLQDRLQQGRQRRQLNTLLDRLDQLEERRFVGDVLPPSSTGQPPFYGQDAPPIIEPDIVDDDDIAPEEDDWQ